MASSCPETRSTRPARPGANAGRFGHFSDLYYDPIRNEWWALSDRGPGGGLLDYDVRLQRIDLDVHPLTGRIPNFKIKQTVKLKDRNADLVPPTADVPNPFALNGLKPAAAQRRRGTTRAQLRPRGAGDSFRSAATS